METKFTKGKWEEHPRARGNIISESGRLVANCLGYSNNFNSEDVWTENMANAKLISAAPEMFEALSAMIRIKDIYMPSDINEVRPEHYDEMNVLFKAFGQMEEAIKKATE